MIEWNARRLAVLDRDIDAIIRSHARDRKVAALLEDTAEAFEEIAEIDLALDWAKHATDFDRGHQSFKAAGYWCKMLAGTPARRAGPGPSGERSARRSPFVILILASWLRRCSRS
jgi:hypothetical protein